MKKITGQTKLAEVLKISQPTISRWISQGIPYRMEGLTYIFILEDVINWLLDKGPLYERFVENYIANNK